MDDDAVGVEEPSWLEAVELERINSNGDITIHTVEGCHETISKRKLVKHSGGYVAFYAIKPEALNHPEPVPETAVVVSEEYTKAVTLTRHIIANAQAMQQSLYEVCKGLKEMRDGKLYKELGYQNFEDYCENEVGLKRRQAYAYVSIAEKLPEDFVHSSAQIGVKKLELLAKLEEADRQALTERIDPNETTVKELKTEIQKLKSEKEQLEDARRSKHQEWLNAMDEITTLTVQKSKLEEQVQELESRPAEGYKDEKDQAEIERLTAENNQLKIENEALEEQRDELEGKLFTMENDCQEGAVSDAEEKRFAEFSSTMNQQLVEETQRIQEEAQEEISRANLQRDNAFAEVTKLREQLALAQKPAVQESLSGSDGEFDAYFRMFDDALKHMTAYLLRKDCTDFWRRQSISMMETKFEKYISALKEK